MYLSNFLVIIFISLVFFWYRKFPNNKFIRLALNISFVPFWVILFWNWLQPLWLNPITYFLGERTTSESFISLYALFMFGGIFGGIILVTKIIWFPKKRKED